MTQAPDRAPGYEIDSKLVYAHGLAAIVTLLIAMTFGIVISLQFIFPDITGNWPPLGWGRLRYAHTQGIMIGWLGNAFLAFMYHAVPILTGRSVTSHRLGLWLFGTWNFAVVAPGWILVLAGVSQPLEWAEFPMIVDAFVVIGLALAAAQFLPSFFRRGLDNLYVSSWYIIGGLIFTLLSYPMGNIVPEFVPGAAGAAFSGLWIHDAVGLFVTPLALAILYFVIPATTGRPIYSHFLSMLGFWGLFFLYPLNGTHHYIFSVIPMDAQMTAIAASALLGVIVVIVVTNLLLSLRGAGWYPRDVGLRFVAMSVIFYLIVSVQGSLQAQMSLNQAVHFTDWVIGHSHLAMLGFATFAGVGGIVHAWQRMPRSHYHARALEWSFILLTVGTTLMVTDLTIAGIVQAKLWLSGAPWLESIQASRPYWIIRSFSAIPISAGFVCLVIGLFSGARSTAVQAIGNPAKPLTEAGTTSTHAGFGRAPGGALLMSYIVASVAGVVFFVMSVSLLGIWPQRVLAEQAQLTAPQHALRPTLAAERGRKVYAREGCAYCHSQQIRYTDADIDRFGAPTLAWETRFDYPHLMGTRRIGPDLARAGNTRTDNWHYVHLFAPRSVVPLSIMPSYAALFEGAPDQPGQDARDLVAYIESLGRAREIAWPDADVQARAAVPDDKRAQRSLALPELNAHPAKARAGGTVPAFAEPASRAIGQRLWFEHCGGCHGDEGHGDGPAAQWLSPKPTNLAMREYTDSLIHNVLWNGVAGTAMPAWRDQPTEHLAALADIVRNFYAPGSGIAPTPAELDQGATVYASHCVECHGDNGDGNGYAAGELPVAPADFRGKRLNLGESVRILRYGIEGTSMAPWTDRLTDEERVAVAQYIRQFFAGEDDRAGARR